jgi:hypothetical protein
MRNWMERGGRKEHGSYGMEAKKRNVQRNIQQVLDEEIHR